MISKKKYNCFWGRASLLGDMVMFLGALNYLKTLYPESYVIFPIAKKCAQAAMLYISHENIDKIHILENWESMGKNDVEIFNSCDFKVNPFPHHPPCPGLTVGIDNFWYNYFDCITETARMAGIHHNNFNKLSEIDRKPKLTQWFETDRKQKSIVIHARAGYNKEQSRNPSTNFWRELTPKIQKMGYKIYHCGVEEEEDIGDNIVRITHLSLFEQIKVALSTDLVLGNDSGFNWIIGAYGHPMISLITNHGPKQTENLNFAPENCKNNNINIFSSKGFENLNNEKILEEINNLKK